MKLNTEFKAQFTFPELVELAVAHLEQTGFIREGEQPKVDFRGGQQEERLLVLTFTQEARPLHNAAGKGQGSGKPARNYTPEQREAMKERLKVANAARKAKREARLGLVPAPGPGSEGETVEVVAPADPPFALWNGSRNGNHN